MKFISDNIREELSLRFAKIQEQLKKSGNDAILIASNANLYYTTLKFFRGYVYIPSAGNPIWFVIRPDNVEEDASVAHIRKPEQIAEWLESHGYGNPGKLELEFSDLTYAEIIRLRNAFPNSEITDGTSTMRNARITKTDWEIERMREDGVHQSEAYRRFTKAYREDMTDVEFQIELERILRLEGCLGYSRTSGNLMEINLGSVLAGDNADVPTPYDFAMGGRGTDDALPVGADGTTMKPGTTIMVDMNGAFNGYQTDMTRVWKIGTISELAVKAHECSRHILRVLEKEGRPGVSCAELYNRALAIAEDAGLKDYFMGHRQKANFIGHGVGIQLNESPVLTPRSRDTLLENMTIAIEPKFVIPHVGAVGVENTYVVKENGLENLTIFPEEIIDLR